MNCGISNEKQDDIKQLCEEFKKYNIINPELYDKYQVKRGLRNADGTGVLAGMTNICNVHGYIVNEGEREPIDGKLIYRGIDMLDIIEGCKKENRYGFEETVYLLIFGVLPNKDQLEKFAKFLGENRDLPENFTEDMIIKAPSPNIMNKLARGVLSLYSYDEEPENNALECEMRKSIQLIAKMPTMMVNAYQVKKRYYDHESMYFHPLNKNESIAESILSTLRDDRSYTLEESRLLDLCLIMHAEHGGGNNSTFSCRVLTSSGTDAYSAYAAAIGSLKGPKHGGANIKVMEMLEYIKAGVKNWDDDSEIYEFLKKLMSGEAGDGSGLIYGIGHAVYTKSDPRAIVLRENAMKLAEGTEYEPEFKLLEAVERLAPLVFAEKKGDAKVISANVDLYSGLVYRMLKIPQDLFTPLFAISRMAGWCAHRMEELMNGKRIMRPAYKAIAKPQVYTPLEER
ncbi:MAG: Citrate synthase [Oscillospiraceae bacterium]|jgi:citrate synthase|nr:Citrate synthase [Oscillospiraceae bacterium]